MKGTVKFFNDRKGYGFITCEEDGQDYFVHSSDLGEGVHLREGDNVTFEVGEGNQGPKAIKVSLE